MKEGAQALRATSGVFVQAENGQLELVASDGLSEPVVQSWRRFSPNALTPIGAAYRSASAVWVETPEELAARFPDLTDAPPRSTAAALPLVLRGQVRAIIGFRFDGQRTFAAEERALVEAMAAQAAQVLDRADAYVHERAARALAEKLQSSLSTTLRSIGDAVIATDARGFITIMNPVAETLTGWGEHDARGRPLADVFRIVSETTRAPIPNPVDKVLALGVVTGLADHTILLRRDGSEVPIDDSGAPIRGDRGDIEGVILVFRDVSEKRREESRRGFLVDATTALPESLDYEETLARIARLAVPRWADWCAVDVVREGEPVPRRLAVAHVDPAKVTFATELAARYPPDPSARTGLPNVLRTGQSELYPDIPDELLVARCVNEEHLRMARNLGLRSAIIVPLAARGRTLGAMTFVFAESGRRYTTDDLAFAEDLARRCAVALDNARLYVSQQRARQSADIANRAKDEFLATVSHELRTPLNSILGWAKMMSSSNFDESRRDRAVDTIERNAIAMAQLIDDLLDMSRIISGTMRLDVQQVTFAAVVDAALESIRPSADAKDIQITPVIDATVPPVAGDPARLQQIIWNLLSNAVKFTPKGGHVDVALRRAGSLVELSVRDSGKGIAPRFLPHVFDPFRQEDASPSRSRGGLGLGLAITRQLVDLHGGGIEVRSDGEGRGAEFTVRLPMGVARSEGPSRARQTPPGEAVERSAGIEGLHVLVVDDDEDARHLVRLILEQHGCRVTLADGTDAALAALRREVPDVLLSDIAMPNRDGLELIREIRKLPAAQGGDIPAAAVTAYARTDDCRRMLDAGFSMHVPKPLEPDELIAVLSNLVRFRIRA